jgi:chromosomal replication initiator protein
MTRLWKGALRDRPLALENLLTPPPVQRNIIPSQKQPITIDRIQEQVRDYFRLRELLLDPSLRVRSNKRIVTFPRQVAMYLARELTPASLAEIGRQFGGKHHTTARHSIGKIEQMRRSDKNLDYTIERLAETLMQR